MKSAVVPLFSVVCTFSTAPNTEVQASCMTANTIIMPYQLTRVYMQVHDTCYQDVTITFTIDVMLIPLKGNGTVPSVFV